MGGKWLELLKEIAPCTLRIAVSFNPKVAPGGGSYYLRTIEGLFRPLESRSPASIRRPKTRWALKWIRHSQKCTIWLAGAWIVIAASMSAMQLAARHRLPAVYGFRNIAVEGGLISYGVDLVDLYRRSAVYGSRILNGERPADLSVQAPDQV